MAKIKVRYGDSWASLESNYPGIQNKNPRTRAPKAGQILQIPDPVIPIQQQKQYLFEPPSPTSHYANIGFVDRNRGMDTYKNIGQDVSKFTGRSPINLLPQPQNNGRYNPYAYNALGGQSGGLSPDERQMAFQGGRGTQAPDYTQLGAALKAAEAISEATGSGGSSKKHRKGGDYVYKNWKGQKIHNWKAMYGIKPPPKPQNTYVKSNRWMNSTGTPSSWRIG